MAQISVEFVLKLASPDGLTPCAIAEGAASLNHETLDDTVKCQALVKPGLGMAHEILHCLGALVCAQLEVHVALVGVEHGTTGQRGCAPASPVRFSLQCPGRHDVFCLGFLVKNITSCPPSFGLIPRLVP